MNTIHDRNNPLRDSTLAADDRPLLRRVSWGAIFAAVIVALSAQLFLSLVGAGIGLSTLDPAQYDSPSVSGFATGTAIWWSVSSIIALFTGGWVAGHLAASPLRGDSMLHGLVTWGLAAIIAFYLLAAAAGSLVRGGASIVGTAVSATARTAAAAAVPLSGMVADKLKESGLSMDDLQSQVNTLLMQTGKPELQPNALEQTANTAANDAQRTAATVGAAGQPQGDIEGLMRRIVASGEDTVSAVDRDALVNVVQARTGISQPEAEQRVDGWIKTYQQARAKANELAKQAEAKAREAADATADATSKAAFAAAFALLLGAIAAALGGAMAGRRYLVVQSVGDNRSPRA